MSWRPDDWKNLHPDDPREHLRGGPHTAYEAGADAILEALKKDSFTRRITLPASDNLTNDLSDFELKSPGWLVFIPEEG